MTLPTEQARAEPKPTWRSITPHRLSGLSLRLMKASNALYNRIDYRDGGTFAEPFTTRHTGWQWRKA